MAQSDTSLAAVEDWKRKCFESSNHSTDVLLSPLLKAFDITTLILSESGDRNDIQRALLTLNAERKISMRFEKEKCDPLRMLFHGLMQSFHLALVKLTKKIHRLESKIERTPLIVGEEPNSPDEIPTSAPSHLQIKKEHITERPVLNDDQDSGTSAAESFVKLEPVDVVDETPPVLIREEVLSESFNEQSNGAVEDNEVDSRSAIVDGPPTEEATSTFHREEAENECNNSMAAMEEASPIPTEGGTTTVVLRRSSRAQKRIQLFGQDSEEEDADRLAKRKRPRKSAKFSASTPERSKSVMERSQREEGVALPSECGQESTSSQPTPETSQANLIVARKNTTTKCIMCDKFPLTAAAYAQHLHIYHKSSLKASGIYLVCSCGDVRRGTTFDPVHSNKCEGRQFTLHKYDDKSADPSK